MSGTPNCYVIVSKSKKDLANKKNLTLLKVINCVDNSYRSVSVSNEAAKLTQKQIQKLIDHNPDKTHNEIVALWKTQNGLNRVTGKLNSVKRGGYPWSVRYERFNTFHFLSKAIAEKFMQTVGAMTREESAAFLTAEKARQNTHELLCTTKTIPDRKLIRLHLKTELAEYCGCPKGVRNMNRGYASLSLHKIEMLSQVICFSTALDHTGEQFKTVALTYWRPLFDYFGEKEKKNVHKRHLELIEFGLNWGSTYIAKHYHSQPASDEWLSFIDKAYEDLKGILSMYRRHKTLNRNQHENVARALYLLTVLSEKTITTSSEERSLRFDDSDPRFETARLTAKLASRAKKLLILNSQHFTVVDPASLKPRAFSELLDALTPVEKQTKRAPTPSTTDIPWRVNTANRSYGHVLLLKKSHHLKYEMRIPHGGNPSAWLRAAEELIEKNTNSISYAELKDAIKAQMGNGLKSLIYPTNSRGLTQVTFNAIQQTLTLESQALAHQLSDKVKFMKRRPATELITASSQWLSIPKPLISTTIQSPQRLIVNHGKNPSAILGLDPKEFSPESRFNFNLKHYRTSDAELLEAIFLIAEADHEVLASLIRLRRSLHQTLQPCHPQYQPLVLTLILLSIKNLTPYFHLFPGKPSSQKTCIQFLDQVIIWLEKQAESINGKSEIEQVQRFMDGVDRIANAVKVLSWKLPSNFEKVFKPLLNIVKFKDQAQERAQTLLTRQRKLKSQFASDAVVGLTFESPDRTAVADGRLRHLVLEAVKNAIKEARQRHPHAKLRIVAPENFLGRAISNYHDWQTALLRIAKGDKNVSIALPLQVIEAVRPVSQAVKFAAVLEQYEQHKTFNQGNKGGFDEYESQAITTLSTRTGQIVYAVSQQTCVVENRSGHLFALRIPKFTPFYSAADEGTNPYAELHNLPAEKQPAFYEPAPEGSFSSAKVGSTIFELCLGHHMNVAAQTTTPSEMSSVDTQIVLSDGVDARRISQSEGFHIELSISMDTDDGLRVFSANHEATQAYIWSKDHLVAQKIDKMKGHSAERPITPLPGFEEVRALLTPEEESTPPGKRRALNTSTPFAGAGQDVTEIDDLDMEL